jgi:hypothetical protein
VFRRLPFALDLEGSEKNRRGADIRVCSAEIRLGALPSLP